MCQVKMFCEYGPWLMHGRLRCFFVKQQKFVYIQWYLPKCIACIWVSHETHRNLFCLHLHLLQQSSPSLVGTFLWFLVCYCSSVYFVRSVYFVTCVWLSGVSMGTNKTICKKIPYSKINKLNQAPSKTMMTFTQRQFFFKEEK